MRDLIIGVDGGGTKTNLVAVDAATGSIVAASKGIIPALQCLRIIKNSGYDGYISLEFEGMEDTLMSIEIGLENMNRYIAQLG